VAVQGLTLSALVLVSFAALCAQKEDPAGPKKLVVSLFNYQLQVPAGWHFYTLESGVPILYNFPRKDWGPQGLFPLKGAVIYCAPDVRAFFPGVDGQILDEVRRTAMKDEAIVSAAPMPSPRSGDKYPRDIIRIVSDRVPEKGNEDEVVRRQIIYAFALGTSRYRLWVEYWRGEENPSYDRTLREILGSVATK
jgi:hypothetical protein